jgi:hypothetical protein
MAGEQVLIPGIDPKYLQIIPKEDSQIKLAYMAGKDLKYFFTAPEFEVVREYVNSLRDLIDANSIRVEKRLKISDLDANGFYIFQPGDEKKFIIVEADLESSSTTNFVANQGSFPVGSEIILLFYNSAEIGTIQYVSNDEIYGQVTHPSNGSIAHLRRVSNLTSANEDWIVTYESVNP